MSVATIGHYSPVNADVVSGGHWLPGPLPSGTPSETPELVLRLRLPGFQFNLGTALGEIQSADNYGVVTLHSMLDPGLIMLVTLTNQVADSAGNLVIKGVSISFEVANHRPRPHFLAASLYAMLPLAGPVQIELPEISLDVTVNFTTPLRAICDLLQRRQTYYGLLVIERACGIDLNIPDFISGEDMNALSFAYHAIVERKFDWLAKFITLPAPATKEVLEWFDSLEPIDPGGSVYKLQFGPELAFRTIFGQPVALGPETVFIEDGILQNREEVRSELAKLDGGTVPIVIRPISGIGRYSLPEAPRLPNSSWDEKIEACIALEYELNERLTDRYNALATSTLAGLTEDEIKVVTERPVLGEDAHLI